MDKKISDDILKLKSSSPKAKAETSFEEAGRKIVTAPPPVPHNSPIIGKNKKLSLCGPLMSSSVEQKSSAKSTMEISQNISAEDLDAVF